MSLSKEQHMIQDMARQFAAAELAPHASRWDEEREIPIEVYREMGRLGLLGMCVPEEWGGAGCDFTSYVLAMEEIAGASAAASVVMSVNNSPICSALLAYGSEAQKQQHLRPLASGEHLGAFCLTEPHTGSDAAAIRSRARKVVNR
ncbi:MAG TPA: acyl-CoA dehydrogenase family protein, partial [Alphaproteobacteria bacterium]|nr:acyl-CoA dehydrogenase family protein [Alphaproteobacteria bacterium]